MAKTKVIISHASAPEEEGILHLGGMHAKHWGLASGMTVTLRFGDARRSLRLAVEPKSTAFRLHSATAGAMGLASGTVLCLRYQAADRSLIIGPLLGVLLRKIGTNPDRPFGNVTGFCREMTEAGKKLGAMVYFFSAERLPKAEAVIHGWTFTGGSWQNGSFPYPDAVYNRITSRLVENGPQVQRFLRTFKARTGGTVFNERYLDKAEVFNALKKDPAVKDYLPESFLYRDALMLKKMLGKHSILFLKPILSSLGKGIIRVRRSAEGFVCHTANSNGTVIKGVFANQAALFKHLKAKMAGRQYLIQEGIDLIRVDGLSTDFRALVQRNDTGQWDVTSIVARVSSNHTFVSNLARGGKLATVKEAIARSNLAAPLHAAAMEKLRKAALEIAQSLERQIDAHFAELGIDLAVDTRGRVLLIEINSKPSKEDNTPLGADDQKPAVPADEIKVRPSVKRVVQYVRHLGKF